MKTLRRLTLLLLVFLAGPLFMAACGHRALQADWRDAARHSAGLVAPASETPEAVVQVWAARAFSWRGVFGVHTWIATKAADADHYLVHEVMGWRARHGGSAVVTRRSEPDRFWFGAPPDLLAELRGAAAASAIERVLAAAADYPHAREYRVWPGPNSNTFTAHVARQVPELRLDLPPTAIGKDYIPGAGLFSATPSGTGYQISLLGALGLLVGLEEGVEVNLLGLTLGVDPLDLAIKLPGVGRFGVY